MQKPSIGRIAHYHSHWQGYHVHDPKRLTTYPAIILGGINDVNDNVVLQFFSGVAGSVVGYTTFEPPLEPRMMEKGIPYSVEPKEGHWSWPKREEDVVSGQIERLRNTVRKLSNISGIDLSELIDEGYLSEDDLG